MHTGGPAEVIPNLCRTMVERGHDVTIVTVDGPHAAALLDAEAGGVEVVVFSPTGLRLIRHVKGLSAFLKQNIRSFDVIHNHGHWLYPNWEALRWAKRFGLPYVTTPHGTLVSGMLKRSRLKKSISWALFDKRIIQYASSVHALSTIEKEGMEDKISSLKKRVIVIPNGVFVQDNEHGRSKQDGEPKKLLFLSRIHTIKGVEDLVELWPELRQKYPEWELHIVGQEDPSSPGTHYKVIAAASAGDGIVFHGASYGSERFQYYRDADAFVLPSYAEGLPTVLLEAAAHSLPIVCTKECNFAELDSADGALVASAGGDSVQACLERLFSMGDQERLAMGRRAQDLIRQDYSWDSIGRRWEDAYMDLCR